jgi:hypothetical protein
VLQAVGLLPGVLAEGVLGDWDAGEPGLALEILGERLSDRHTPLSAGLRGRLGDLADRYGVAARVRPCLRLCPDADLPDPPWVAVEDTQAAIEVLVELDAEIGPGHCLAGRDLTPWLTCRRCGEVLVRVDDADARAGRAPYRCAVVRPTWSGRPEAAPVPVTALYASLDAALDHFLHAGDARADG